MSLKRALLTAACIGLMAGSAFAQVSSVVPQATPPGPSPWMFAFTGMETGQAVFQFTPTSGQVSQASKQASWTPDYPVYNCRFALQNWMMKGGTAGPQEVDGGGIITVNAFTVQTGGGGPPVQATYNGATSFTIAAGATIWTDPLPVTFQPRSKVFTIPAATFQQVTGAVFGMFQPNPFIGEAWEIGASSFAADAISGNVPNTGSASLGAWGASAGVCQGWDGRPVSLIYGDSIGTGTGEAATFSDDRGNKGWVARGLDYTGTSNQYLRLPFAKWTAPSAATRQISTAADFTRRFAMIDALPNPPFTYEIGQIGTNDATGTTAAWEARLNPVIAIFKAKWPQVKYVQLGWPPFTTTDTSVYTTVAGQTMSAPNDWPTGINPQVQNYYAGLPTNVDNFIPVSDFFDNSTTRCGAGGGTAGKWRVDQTYSSTLSSASGANATVLQLAAAPGLGAALAVNPNGTGAQNVTVSAVSGGIATSYAVTVTPAVTAAMTVGTVVREVAAVDGLHPSSTTNQTVAPCLGAVKSNYIK